MEERRIFPTLPIVHHYTSLNGLLAQCLIYPVALYTIVEASRMFIGHIQYPTILICAIAVLVALFQTTLKGITITRPSQRILQAPLLPVEII